MLGSKSFEHPRILMLMADPNPFVIAV
jgi:hypothetical protein